MWGRLLIELGFPPPRMNFASEQLSLSFGFAFEDLYTRDGAVRIDQAFLEYLKEGDSSLYERLLAARENPGELAKK